MSGPGGYGPFPCAYRDGKSSRTHDAEVTFRVDSVVIAIADGGVTAETVEWPVSEIKTTDVPLADVIELRFGTFPFQTIVMRSAECIEALRASYGGMFFRTGMYDAVLKSRRRIALAACVGVFALLLLYFVGAPALSDAVVSLLPPSQEAFIGGGLFEGVTRDFEPSEPMTEAVSRFAETLDFAGPTPTIRVFDEEEVNAFAVMGGYIGIYVPMLELIETPDELAALIAHEYGHIEKRHSARLIFRALSGYMIFSALFGDFSGATVTILQNADTLNTLRYSRKFESEADDFAIGFLSRNGMDGLALANLFDRISENNDKAGPEWLSSHPDLLARIERVERFSPVGEGQAVLSSDADSLRLEAFEEIRALTDSSR